MYLTIVSLVGLFMDFLLPIARLVYAQLFSIYCIFIY